MPTKQTESAPNFLRVYTQVRRDRMKHSFLRQIIACVDWRGIRTLLNKKYTKTQNATGNPAYDALMMFKILLLQTWYGLSDYESEERINDSLLFSEFLLLDIALPAPDHSTICRFRAELTRLGIMDKLLRELNKQFKKHGISRIDQGAIVDASIVDSPYAPDGSILIEVADDREDLRTEEEQAQEQAYQYELKSRKPGGRYGSSLGAQRPALSLRVQKARTDRWARLVESVNYHASQLCRYGGIARAESRRLSLRRALVSLPIKVIVARRTRLVSLSTA